MNRDETAYWLDSVIPAPVEFKIVEGHRLALAALPGGENLVATTQFANVDTDLSAEGLPVRCELLTVARATQPVIAQFVLAAAQRLQEAKVIPAQPGTLLPQVAGRHGLLIAPYLWGGQTPQVKEEGRWTLALQLLALSDAEYAYAREEGVAAFQQAVAEQGIDLLDWSREDD